MQAQRIIQDFLSAECPSIHAKRRASLAVIADAGSQGNLSLMGMSRVLKSGTALRHRIKRCDRLLGNDKLDSDRSCIYRAMTQRVLRSVAMPLIVIDWSDLRTDRSFQLLRAALVVRGRALTLYEEVHPISVAGSLKVHAAFMSKLKAILPTRCLPVFVTDAGFRSTWFKLLDSFGYAWVGRIRNRDMVRECNAIGAWRGCKVLYSKATSDAKDLGEYEYVRNNPVPCRLVLFKKRCCGRHDLTVHRNVTKSSRSMKQAKGSKEPWLLAVSPKLDAFAAKAIVGLYEGRMQIEQTFRDTKNPHWGLGLTSSQTRKADRLANLLLIGALACFALWIVGLAAKCTGYRIEYGSKAKAAQALSIISLARWWIADFPTTPIPRALVDDSLDILGSTALLALVKI
jgi:hypothetical protein